MSKGEIAALFAMATVLFLSGAVFMKVPGGH
jgi:hypothetical protein